MYPFYVLNKYFSIMMTFKGQKMLCLMTYLIVFTVYLETNN